MSYPIKRIQKNTRLVKLKELSHEIESGHAQCYWIGLSKHILVYHVDSQIC
jgi:hypothetical protein